MKSRRKPVPDVGSAILERRKQRRMTLEALAAASGVSRAMLSEVERGRKSPTIRVSAQIAEGLGCSLSDLLAEEPSDATYELVRQHERSVFVDESTGVQRDVLSPRLRQSGIEVVKYTLPARATAGPFPGHQKGVIEHVTVLRGKVRQRVGDTRVELAVGDGVTYDAHTPHETTNLNRSTSEYLVVIVREAWTAKSSRVRGRRG